MAKGFQYTLAVSDMYQLLSMFSRLPTLELSAGILDGSISEDICDIMKELDFPQNKIDLVNDKFECIKGDLRHNEKFLSDMRREYTRLFAHPNKSEIDIYETLFVCEIKSEDAVKPALFISPAAIDAERCYRRAGLTLSKEVREPSDHIATEMEFMMFLYIQKAKALQENNVEEYDRREAEIKEFTELHLKKWAKEFFDACSTSSKNNVYRTFGEIGKLFMGKVIPC